MLPFQKGSEFLALLIAAQLHRLHTLLLILERKQGTRPILNTQTPDHIDPQ